MPMISYISTYSSIFFWLTDTLFSRNILLDLLSLLNQYKYKRTTRTLKQLLSFTNSISPKTIIVLHKFHFSYIFFLLLPMLTVISITTTVISSENSTRTTKRNIMADHSSQPFVVDECRGVLFVYNDGSIVRSNKPSFDTPIHDDGSVLWKDVVFDNTNKLELRLYKPSSHSISTKLPIFYYIHGGGYCIGSRTWPNCHNFCLRLAFELQAVVISPDYRLAPENCLPAAIDDGFMALKWLQDQALSVEKDRWLSDVADFDRVFVSGDSAGGNVAHNLSVRLGAGSPELAPVRIRGYVHLAAFFGGTVRTKSEAEGPKDSFLNLDLIDRYWRLSIPLGETTDHPLVNPFGPNSPNMQEMDLDPILAIMGGDDLLRDRVREYVEKLKSWGKRIEYVEFEGKQHGFFALDPNTEAAKEVVKLIKNFILENSG